MKTHLEYSVGSPSSTRDKTNSNLQYINRCNPHLISRFCGIKLDLKLTSNIQESQFLGVVIGFMFWVVLLLKRKRRSRKKWDRYKI